MLANAGVQVVIERLDNIGAIISTVINSEKGTELTTSSAVQNWTGAPTSTTFNKGDRIRIRIAANDAGGTMASGHTVSFVNNGPTGGASGDSFVTFNETFTLLETDPSGTQIFPTNAASDIVDQGAGVDEKEMWTSRGGGVTTAVRDTVAGFTAPLQWTTTAGGNVIEWYSKRLAAFTLADLVKLSIRGATSLSNTWAQINVELAVVNNDGSGATVFGSWGMISSTGSGAAQLEATEAAQTIYISGQDLAFSDGQRLRLRLRLDDASVALITGRTATVWYAGTSGGASGDSWIQLSQSVSEFVSTPPAVKLQPNPHLIYLRENR